MKILVAFLIWAIRSLPVNTTADRYDICVYGATSAGVIAAYAAAKQGKKVIVIEPGTHIGGLTSGGLGYTDIGNKYAISGLSLDFYRRMGQHYGKFEQWIFEPHVADSIFRDYLKRGNIRVLSKHRLESVSVLKKSIKQITLGDFSHDTQKRKTIIAKMFIDCSYEGDLMAMAGVSYTTGRESNDQYGETFNGVQLLSGHQFPHKVDPYRIKGDPQSGLLWGISPEKIDKKGSGDKKIQAYNFRICLTNNENNRIPITRPDDYDSSRYELLLRLFDAQPDRRKLNDYFIFSLLPNGKTDINNRGGFSTDMIGFNYQYPEGNWEQRSKIIREHESYTKGLLYFYLTDARVPETLREQMSQWGYPKDEYKENFHWSPQLYIRESRRMVGSYVMTQANCEAVNVVEDGVGMAAYTMDSHNCQRIVLDGMVKNEGNVEVGGGLPYPVSFRSLVPKKEECVNLLVPVCLSATHIAYGSIRMEPVFMMLAQSAAIAATEAINNKLAIQDVDVAKIQAFARIVLSLDGSVPEILIDNQDSAKVLLQGEWEVKRKGGFGTSYLVSDTVANSLLSARFAELMKKSGEYDVYSYYIPERNSAAVVYFEVADGAKTYSVKIHKKGIVVQGQTSGEWVKLGRFTAEEDKMFSVKIFNGEGKGSVIADAVLFVPVKE